MGNEAGPPGPGLEGDGNDLRDEVVVGQAGAGLVRIDFYPEVILDETTARGRFYVYVRDRLVEQYDACGGPPPGLEHADRGGHFASQTQEGAYVLGAQERYTTQSWPTSTVPWGAQLRARDDQEIEFSTDGATWLPATGLDGCVTRSWVAFELRTRAARAAADNAAHRDDPAWTRAVPEPPSDRDIRAINVQARGFFHSGGVLSPTYVKNDFGKWAWNLEVEGPHGLSRTGMFVHTTPADEAATAAGISFQLTDSHGCIHIRPADRDEMMNLGYLQKGVHFVVKRYGLKDR